MDPLREKLLPLHKLVGTWKTTGSILSTADSPAIAIIGTDTYSWLPGEYFLAHTADVMIGSDRQQTHEIIGYEPAKDCFFTHFFNNNGESGTMIIMVREPLWVFHGGTLRFTGGFSDNDQTFAGIWERVDQEKLWHPFMNIRLERENGRE